MTKGSFSTMLSFIGNMVLASLFTEAKKQASQLQSEKGRLENELRSLRGQVTEQQKVITSLRASIEELKRVKERI